MNVITVKMECGHVRTFESNLSIPQIQENNMIGKQHFHYRWIGPIAKPMVGVIASLTIS